ncbi:type II toxin-antitoxin system RelE/ParE family toxin [Pedobacter soli]|uniref:RelE toxin of RelE / RelB toxin-antitoxin system n=1 Tax=Pedobacter soli TaxID=390242 RepID=A0A1G6LUT2_9SPHI|nr:type II toxin-antitoxin system RelE/ParE family toxin [Pedobacter soli]SDC46515.1 RelE toxin of RelE / RelB toxin-antitoxin system [Pedobacter soli]
MANEVIYSSVFIKKAKIYKKKYLSLVEDLYELEEKLLKDPHQGNDLGAGLYKIRLAIKSKGKGKSGGFRIITYLVSNIPEGTIINMLTLYDKSEESSIDKKELQKLIKAL